jgi:hypothetical protein
VVKDLDDSEILSATDKVASRSEDKSLDIIKQNEALNKLVG